MIGRFFNGFGSARSINRRFIADTFSRSERTAASAAFVTAGALGMAVGEFSYYVYYIGNTQESIGQDATATKGKVDAEFKHGVVMGDLHEIAHGAEKLTEGPKPTEEESHMFDKFRK